MLKRLGIMLLLIPLLLSAEIKIGYIDSHRLLEGYKGSREITENFNIALREWETEAMRLRQELERMVQEFESQLVILSERARETRRAAIGEKQREHQEFIQRIWGPGGEAETRQREVMQPFIDKVNEVIREIGEEAGYTMIFDIAAMGVVYAPMEIDLTQIILDELNREYIDEEEEVVFAGFEGIEFYVLRLQEKNQEAQDFGLGTSIKEKLRAAIIGMEGYREVRPAKMRDAFMLANIATSEDRLTDDEIKTIGRLADANYILSGEVEKTAEIITVRVDVLDVEKEALIKSYEAKSDGEREEDIINLVSGIVAEFLPYMRGSVE